MKRKITFLTAAFVLLAFLVPITGWGQTRTEITWTASEQGYENAQSLDGVSIELNDYVTIQFDKNAGSNAPAYYNTGSAARMYPKNSLTVTPASGYQITGMTLTFSGTSNTGALGASNGTYSLSSATGTWSGSSSDAIVLTNNATSGHARLQVLTVTYTDGSTSTTPTTVTIDASGITNTDLFNGTEAGLLTATVSANSTPISGATVTWESNDNDIATINANGVVTLVAVGSTTITAFYAGNDTYGSSSATYPIEVTDSTPFDGVIFDATVDKGTSPIVKDNVSFACTNGVLNNGSEYRLYKNSITTISVTGDSIITKIEFICTSSNPASGFGEQTGWTISGDNGVWEGEVESVSFVASGAQVRATMIKVTVSQNTNPSITATNVEIAYDATSGSFDFTLNNPVSGGQLSVEENVDWIEAAEINTTNGYSVTFETTVNQTATAREGIITLTYTYNNRETITKDVTVTQLGNPNVFDNIEDITGAGNYRVKGTVVATSSKGFIIGDGTGYVYTYLNAAPSYGIGVNLSISGTTSTNYGHVIQFTNAATIETVEETNYNGDPQPTVITEVPDYSEGNHLSTYLEFEGALSKTTNGSTYYNVAIGNSQNSKIRISYPTTGQATELDALVNKTVRVHGFFTGISGTNGNSVFTAMMESVEDLTPVTPVINADNVTLLYDATSGEIAYTISNPVTGVALEATTDAEWIDNITVGEASVTFTCSANEGTEDRTASFTLTYEGAENKVVNVTQGHYVVDFAVLPFEWAGGVKNDLLALNGVTANGLGSDYGDNNAPYRVKFDTEGDYIQVKTNEQPGIVTVGVKMIGGATTSKIVVQGSSDGVDFNNAIDTLVVSGKQNDTLVLETTHDFASTDRYVRLYFIKGSNVGVGPISIAQFDNTPSISASDVEIEYDVTSGAIVYTINRPVEGGVLTASVPDGSWVTLGTIGETVPFTCTANTAYTARTAIVTLTYTYGEESVTKDVTVTQSAAPEPLITLAPNMVNVGAEGGLCGFAVSLANIPTSGPNQGIGVYFYPAPQEWIPLDGIIYHNFYLNPMQMDSLYLTVLPNTTTESRSVDIRLVINGIVSNLVTIVQAAPYAPAFYTLATTIESGKQYIIVGLEGEKAYAMGEQKNNNRGGVIISKDGDTATVTRDAVYEFVITSSGENYTIYDARTPGYLCAASSNSNYLRTQVENDANGIWAIEIDQESGLATVEAQGSFTRRKMRFNYNGGNALFSCYASSSTAGTQVYFYVKDEVNTPSSYPLDIAGFGESEKGGYRLIASPINNLNPTAEGMTAGIYDLYAFDQSKESEWINYKAGAFNLISGKGYLYASKVDTTLSFIGSPYNGDGAVTLVYIDGAQFAGWNLIGNPFATAATLDKPYYRLNSDGSSLNTFTENTSVACMEGVFVKATEAGQTATFTAQTSKGEKKGIALLNLMVSGNRGMVNDNAIIRFDNGQTLEKFVLRKNGTKLYIVEGNKDYAIVRSNGQGEMPVNFKAETNGNYTISVDAENVEMNYLHLIDNLTGADVDLLATPSYSFEANTNDYATRFRLVFKANASVSENADAETFAFFNGSTWTVSNLGEATLQVVDMTGRVLSSEIVNGNAEISINQTPGVYMLRLVNGDNVKVQKVVVK